MFYSMLAKIVHRMISFFSRKPLTKSLSVLEVSKCAHPFCRLASYFTVFFTFKGCKIQIEHKVRVRDDAIRAPA